MFENFYVFSYTVYFMCISVKNIACISKKHSKHRVTAELIYTLYNVCAVPWGDIMSTVGVILSTVGDVLSTAGMFSTVGDIMMHVGEYHEFCGGYHDTCGGYHDTCEGYHDACGGILRVPWRC